MFIFSVVTQRILHEGTSTVKRFSFISGQNHMTAVENFPMVQQGLFSTGLELPRKIHFSQISFIPTLQKIILTSKLFSEEKSDYLFK